MKIVTRFIINELKERDIKQYSLIFKKSQKFKTMSNNIWGGVLNTMPQ